MLFRNKLLSMAVALPMLFTAFNTMADSGKVSLDQEYQPIVKQLNLSADQVKKITELRETAQKNIDGISTADIKDGVIIDMFKSRKWDEKGVKKQIKAVGQAQDEYRYYRIKYLFDVGQVLSAEQSAKLQNLLKEDGVVIN